MDKDFGEFFKIWRFGNSPKSKKGKTNFEFQKSLGIILKVILSPHRGTLGEKRRNGVT